MKGCLLTNDSCTILCRYSAPLLLFPREKTKKQRGLVRCSSSAPSLQRTLRSQHNSTSVKGGKILRKDPCSPLQQFPPLSHASSSLPLCAPSSSGCQPQCYSFWLILALSCGGRRNMDAGWTEVNEVEVLIFFFFWQLKSLQGKLRWTTD